MDGVTHWGGGGRGWGRGGCPQGRAFLLSTGRRLSQMPCSPQESSPCLPPPSSRLRGSFASTRNSTRVPACPLTCEVPREDRRENAFTVLTLPPPHTHTYPLLPELSIPWCLRKAFNSSMGPQANHLPFWSLSFSICTMDLFLGSACLEGSEISFLSSGHCEGQ